ncbi:RNA polymerase sigma factor RpoE [Labilithrix luteola]|uniref:RNA polymerase sigma factor RpoE n=2 Tax=Labilithrix luteola TaxID=1391654 RepID=A0A0K1Q9N4_9BACT|nr:RNA polymerase sigma factor RpoE [Labilithrix luteola]
MLSSAPTADREVTSVSSAPTVREIVLSHGRYVWRLLRFLGVPERDLDDLCQEVFTTVHQKRGALSDTGLRSWLYAICTNHARNYRKRAHHRREALVEAIPESSVAPSQEEGLELAQAQEQLLLLLDRLDDDKRTIFVLHAIEEVSMEDAAEIVGCPLSTAYFRFRRARAQLEAAMVKQ